MTEKQANLAAAIAAAPFKQPIKAEWRGDQLVVRSRATRFGQPERELEATLTFDDYEECYGCVAKVTRGKGAGIVLARLAFREALAFAEPGAQAAFDAECAH